MAAAAIFVRREHERERALQEANAVDQPDMYSDEVNILRAEKNGFLQSMLQLFRKKNKVVPEGEEAVEPQVPKDYYYNREYWPNTPKFLLHYFDIANAARKFCIIDPAFGQLVLMTIIVAGINVGLQAYPSIEADPNIKTLDNIILAIFSLEVILKVVMEGFAPWKYFTGPEYAWNTFDFAIVLLSYPIWGNLFGGGSGIAMLRLVRLARLGKLVRKIPALNMIISGLIGGMSSIVYIVILLFLVFYLYGVMGFYLFAANDPLHFGSLPLAMVTLFRIATLTNWGDVMWLNILGCDVYPGASPYYVGPSMFTPENQIFWCRAPGANWIFGPLYFVTFVVLSAMVMLSLFIGTVTISMTEAMEELKKTSDEAKAAAAAESNMKRMAHLARMQKKEERKNRATMRASMNKDASGRSSPLGVDKIADEDAGLDNEEDEEVEEEGEEDPLEGMRRRPYLFPYYLYVYLANKRLAVEASERKVQMAAALKIAMGNEDKLTDEMEAIEAERKAKQSKFERLYLALGKKCNEVIQSPKFQNLMTLAIVLASINCGVQTDNRVMRYEVADIVSTRLDDIILYYFTLEILLKLIGLGFKPWRYFRDNWHKFDFLIVVGSFLPGGGSTVKLLRLLRLLRVLKLVKRLPALQVIVNALLDGLSSIFYVGLVLFLFYYVFAIVGMILFQQNDPWHFGSLHASLITLFRASTLDNWTELMYISMYGCDQYSDIYLNYPNQCHTPERTGALAVFYHVVFIFIGAQVLLSLFIGVISTSMDNATQNQKEEKILEEKIKKTAKRLLLTEDRVEAFKYVFSQLDLDNGGTIEPEELKIGLDAINAGMDEDQIGKLYDETRQEVFEQHVKAIQMRNNNPNNDPEPVPHEDESGGIDPNGFIIFMCKTPMFSNGAAMARIGSTLQKNTEKKKKAKKKDPWYMPLVDLVTPGGKKGRLEMEMMEAAFLIQEKWLERKAARKAKEEAAVDLERKHLEKLKREKELEAQLKAAEEERKKRLEKAGIDVSRHHNVPHNLSEKHHH